jgi:hypothetical protein
MVTSTPIVCGPSQSSDFKRMQLEDKDSASSCLLSNDPEGRAFLDQVKENLQSYVLRGRLRAIGVDYPSIPDDETVEKVRKVFVDLQKVMSHGELEKKGLLNINKVMLKERDMLNLIESAVRVYTST